MRAHLLFDHHLAVILKDLVHVLCDASRFDASPVGVDVCGRANVCMTKQLTHIHQRITSIDE